MVVTRKAANSNAPPAPTRTNSSTSSPKAAKKASLKGSSHLKDGHLATSGVENKPVAPPMPKPHLPAPHPEDDGPFGMNPTFLPSPSKKVKAPVKKHVKKGKARDKSSKGKKMDRRSLSTLEVLLRILLLLLSIYSVLVCPKDTKDESAICRKLSVARERLFDPYIWPPINFVAHHPAIAPHIARAKPHVGHAYTVISTQYGALHRKVEVATRPYVVQVQREYNIRLQPQVRLMQYNWRRYRRQAQPYINQAYAGGLHLWFRAAPYATPVLMKIKEAPTLANFYLVKPLEEAKQKWVDPQLRKIVEKVEEMNASASEEASTVASAAEDTITPTTGNSDGNRRVPTTWMTSSVPVDSSAVPPNPPMDPTNSRGVGVENTGAVSPIPSEPPANTDSELEAFLDDLLKEETIEPVAAFTETGPTPEDLVEQARLRKEETARKRADLEARHTKWEEELKKTGERYKQELVDALVASRESALYDVNDQNGVIQIAISDLKKEMLKAEKHLRLYLEELNKDTRSNEHKFNDWKRVFERVNDRCNEKTKDTQDKIQKWMLGWVNSEQGLVEGIAEKLIELGDRAQSDLGMDYSWLDDVSTHDWTRYHALNGEARRWGEVYRDLYTGTDLEAPANPVNLRLNEVQTSTLAWVNEIFDANNGLHLEATEKWQPREEVPVPEAPDASILPIDVEEPSVMVGGVPIDQVVLGRGKEEVEEAFARARTPDEL